MNKKPIISIKFEHKNALRVIEKQLQLLNYPKKLIRILERYIHAVTMQMFRGQRPDTGGRRDVKWPKLADSTITQKILMHRNGTLSGGATPSRPMVRTGRLRDSLKILNRTKNGFIYGTRILSKNGFSYPGYHNVNKFPWLFINNKDIAQFAKIVRDYLRNNLKTVNGYVQK